jgi:hypothetical protein
VALVVEHRCRIAEFRAQWDTFEMRWAGLFLVLAGCSSAPVPLPGAIVQLSHDAAQAQTFLNNARCLAVDEMGTVHVVWVESTPPGKDGLEPTGQLFYTRSLDGGMSFAAPKALSGMVTQVGSPKLVAAGNALYAVWHQEDANLVKIFFARSDDGGDTWTILPAIGNGSFPSLDAGGSAVQVVWNDPQRAPSFVSEVFLASSTDGGHTFAPPIMVSSDDGRSSWTAAVALSGSVVHVAWTDERHDIADCGTDNMTTDCREEEYYRRSPDGGLTWGPEVRLTDDPEPSWCPSILADGDTVHLSWFDHETGRWEVFERRSFDGGLTWDAQRSITQASGDTVDGAQSIRPSLAKRGDALALLFWVIAPATEGVWTTSSLDDGTTWSKPQLLSTSSPARHPAVVLDGNATPHVAWYQPQDGVDQMFYRKLSPLGR